MLSRKFEALAILALLAKGDSELFHHNLIRSGRVRAAYLLRLQELNITSDHHRASGRCQAFLDAVAAGAFDLGESIAQLSPADWQEGHEYPDDYCYAQLVQRLARPDASGEEMEQFFSRLELYLEGQASSRLDVCRALAARDQASFESSFEALLDEREATIFAAKDQGQLEELEVIAARLIFVEGLAILRIAERRGLTTQTEYRLCPSVARAPMRAPPENPQDAF